MSYVRMSVPLLASSLLWACGGAAVPQQQLTASEAAIRGAETAGAPDVPKAALHLKQARDQVQAAKALIEEDENERAEIVLQRAQADAELALALANEARAKQEAAEAVEEVELLRQKLDK